MLGADWAQWPTVLITGHRRENFGDGIEQICQAIATLAERFPDHRFVYPVHLNPNVLTHVNRLLGGLPNVRLIAPQNYRNFVALMARCRLVLTDSGGVQEEAPSLGKPVLVMRDTTERPEGVAAGTALLTGPKATAIIEHADAAALGRGRLPRPWRPPKIPTATVTPPTKSCSESATTLPQSRQRPLDRPDAAARIGRAGKGSRLTRSTHRMPNQPAANRPRRVQANTRLR